MTMSKKIQNELRSLSKSEIAEHSQRFFKTGKGEYGEGDKFLGIRVPILRKLARKYNSTSIEDVSKLIKSKFHEERLLSLIILVDLFKRASEKEKKRIYIFYLENAQFVNNWDLVDCSAEHLVGAFLYRIDKKQLYTLANSNNFWERRISIISTFHFIKQNEFDDSLKISEVLLHDEEDLIHKAVGWMLREIGKRDLEVEEGFLKKHYKNMPRTMLRYAIEKFSEIKRKNYLRGEI